MKALALIAVVLALAGCGSEDADEAGAPGPVTVTETVTEPEPEPEPTEPEPEAGCSTAGLRLTLPEQDLPAEVAEVRQRVFDAAVACNYDTLEQIALERGEGFTFSFGGGDSAAAFWRDVEEAGTEEPLPMRALAQILALPYTRNEAGSYAWPTAYDESPEEADWQALVDAGLYSREELELMQTQGTGYLGYRTAITPDGDWQFFTAGD
ncbi:MAG TPA: hypothetical protein VML35_08980 [Gaiellaceae bacterium]|nr:hypothetical protein [Gaiellaceae bacterium]